MLVVRIPVAWYIGVGVHLLSSVRWHIGQKFGPS